MKMISAHIMGGLGNQLFQIFNLIAYALEHKIPFFFELQKEENRERPFYWNTFLLSLKGFIKPSEKCKHILKERQYHYEELPEYSLIKKPFKFFGYFQSYKYFYEHQKTIYRFIKLEQQQQKIHKAYNTVYNFNNTISLHFRIGDYKDLQHHHPIMKIEYYVNALELICDHTSKIDWNILYFYEKQDTNEVSNKVNTLKDKFPKMSFIPIDTTIPDYNQLLLMSLCCHNIIANSSFSWWGAYFNFNSDKIVCHPPHKDWFGPAQGDKNLGDLFPHTWVTINDNKTMTFTNINCLHYLLPNNKLLEDNDFKQYVKNLKHNFFILPTNHICVHILDSIHYNALIGNLNFHLYDKYVKLTHQTEHSVENFTKLLHNFDLSKIEKIDVYEKKINNNTKIIIRDGCHRMSILLFKKYSNIHRYIKMS